LHQLIAEKTSFTLKRPERRFSMKTFLVALFASFVILVPGFAAALEVGDPAPLFEALSDKGPVKLLDYRGQKNVVLAFYFADYTPV